MQGGAIGETSKLLEGRPGRKEKRNNERVD
jgi:hypothetical protein